MKEHIRMERDGEVGIITIDRRERFNSFDVQTAQDFRKAGLQFAREERVRAVVIRGCGGAFCSGPALKYIRSGGNTTELGYLKPEAREVPSGYGEIFKQILEYLHSTISEIKRAPKPFIAAVDGVAAAGGFGIAMACDLVLASERASFEWAYPKTGLTGAESSTFFLPRLLGVRPPPELGFFYPRPRAEKLPQGPTKAYAVAKSLIHQAAGVDRLDHHLDRELESLARIADGRDFSEGLESFFLKRPPAFEGR